GGRGGKGGWRVTGGGRPAGAPPRGRRRPRGGGGWARSSTRTSPTSTPRSSACAPRPAAPRGTSRRRRRCTPATGARSIICRRRSCAEVCKRVSEARDERLRARCSRARRSSAPERASGATVKRLLLLLLLPLPVLAQEVSIERDNVDIAPAPGVTIKTIEVDNRLGNVTVIGRDAPGITLSVVKKAPDAET